MLFTLEKVGLYGQKPEKEKRINFLLLLTLPPWYCIKHSCGMLITLVNPHVIFLLLEVIEWFKPSWILTWIQFLYLIPLLSLEYVQLRKSIHQHTWRKNEENCGRLHIEVWNFFLTFDNLKTSGLLCLILSHSTDEKKFSLCWDILFHEIQHRIPFFFMNWSNLTVTLEENTLPTGSAI